MNILAVWTLFIEHPLYNPAKDCACRWCWTRDWGKRSVSISLTLSLCPDIVPHSNLSFTLQLFCSVGWKDGWKLVPTLMPEWGQSPWAFWPLESSSAPSTSQSQRWPGLCSCVAGSCFQHLDKHMGFECTTRWVENWLNCQDGRVVISSSKSKSCPSGINGRAKTVSYLPLMIWTMGQSVLPAASQVSPNRRVDNRLEGTVLQLEKWCSTSLSKLNKSNWRALPPGCDTPRKQDRMRLTGEKADLQKRFRVLLGNKQSRSQW